MEEWEKEEVWMEMENWVWSHSSAVYTQKFSSFFETPYKGVDAINEVRRGSVE